MSQSTLRLSPRMEGVEASPTVKLNSLAQEMIRAGKDIVNLTAGETDFDTPQGIKDAAIKALQAGQTRYTAPHGIPELRQAISAWFLRDFGLNYSPSQTTVTVGVKQGIFHLILATVGPGDEVLIPRPYWVSYPEMVRLAGGTPVLVNCDDAFRLDLDDLRAKLSPRSRLLLLNSPNNPSGAMNSAEDLKEIARLLEGTAVLVSSDEIYSSLVYDGAEFVSFAKLSEDAYARTVTFNGLSKSHAMTGWRVGFAAGPINIIEAMGILQAQSSTHITSFVQPAAVEALKRTAEDFAPSLKAMQERRDLTVKLLRQIPGLKIEVPAGAFYVFPDVSAHIAVRGGGSAELAEYLLLEGGVAVVPGKPFGDDRRIRISFAKDLKTLEKGLERVRAALQKIIP
ncbi:MAG: pyridoxal phosphate-dependent aminotransferase [Proteobacteria bacterium]|nr:MAG: pyridoxal phosphate-dependent aminotransferase [Pseudomonadota bacterium]